MFINLKMPMVWPKVWLDFYLTEQRVELELEERIAAINRRVGIIHGQEFNLGNITTICEVKPGWLSFRQVPDNGDVEYLSTTTICELLASQNPSANLEDASVENLINEVLDEIEVHDEPLLPLIGWLKSEASSETDSATEIEALKYSTPGPFLDTLTMPIHNSELAYRSVMVNQRGRQNSPPPPHHERTPSPLKVNPGRGPSYSPGPSTSSFIQPLEEEAEDEDYQPPVVFAERFPINIPQEDLLKVVKVKKIPHKKEPVKKSLRKRVKNSEKFKEKTQKENKIVKKKSVRIKKIELINKNRKNNKLLENKSS